MEKAKKYNFLKNLDRLGNEGVLALAAATPVETGKTASSWYYTIEFQNEWVNLSFCNSNVNKGVPIALIIQYGHGTGTGGWVEGRDYINPALKPIFDKIAKDAWEEVKRL